MSAVSTGTPNCDLPCLNLINAARQMSCTYICFYTLIFLFGLHSFMFYMRCYLFAIYGHGFRSYLITGRLMFFSSLQFSSVFFLYSDWFQLSEVIFDAWCLHFCRRIYFYYLISFRRASFSDIFCYVFVSSARWSADAALRYVTNDVSR